jgi:hypothetical protein
MKGRKKNKKEEIIIEELIEIRPAIPCLAYTLKIGKWKSLFPRNELLILVSESLNLTLKHHRFCETLVGYLITDKRVCLILQPDSQPFLDNFYLNTRDEIMRRLDQLDKNFLKKRLHELEINLGDLTHHLFEQRNLLRNELYWLMLGKEVKLPYYSPHLARLKDRIHNYPYCSAIDYSGAKGPVNMTFVQGEPIIEEVVIIERKIR